MNLEYKILWIEDESEWVQSEIEFLEDYLEIYGFTLNCKNIEKYEKCNFSEFDIVAVDFNLATQEKGQDVIKKIRDQEFYTDILFYSREGENKMRRLAKDLDGVYCASKDSYRDKLKGLIYTTIRKTQELNNLRGLVMAETSELDEMIKSILKLLTEKDKVEERKITERQIKLSEKCKEIHKEIEQYSLPSDFIKLLYSGHFTAGFSHRTLCSFSCCDKNNLQKGDLFPYLEDIIQTRNDLAHNPENSSTSFLMKINGIEYNEKKFIKIRKKIQKYKQLFQEIIDELSV